MFSVRARAIMAIEHCSSSVNPVVTDLVKTAVTPRSTDRLSAPQMLVKTPTVQSSVQSHRQSGLIITLCKTFYVFNLLGCMDSFGLKAVLISVEACLHWRVDGTFI